MQRAPGECKPLLGDVMGVVLEFLAWDPNYADDMEEEEGRGSDEDDEE